MLITPQETFLSLDDAGQALGCDPETVRELAAGTGLSSSSLYATFGGKHDLYLASLRQYRQVEYDEMARLLADPRPVRATLAEVFARLIDRLMADPARRGAFTLNAAVELGGQDEAVTAELRAHFDDIGVLLGRRLAEAQAEREIAARGQYEADIEAQIRRDIAAGASDDLRELQAQIAALSISLETMMGHELPDDRVALPNERLRELSSALSSYTGDDSLLAATDFASTAPPAAPTGSPRSPRSG